MGLLLGKYSYLVKWHLGETSPIRVIKSLKETHLLADFDDFSLTSLSVPSIL
ncbi:hypothetical protein B0G93_10952 [Bacillus sp. V-88]|jgi:hypothetical protein|nr:hypothetical protein B0G93_10952 [Bacillus sp. V-88]SLK22745.1 hypothetical protein SAMN06295884_10952 [Bacillus sp. V-88]